MSQSAISIHDISARIYATHKDGSCLEDYYQTIFDLRSLFDSPLWRSSVTGFYLNCISCKPYTHTVRIAYLVSTMTTAPVDIYEAYAQQNGLVTAGFDELTPAVSVYTSYYGGDELLFRRYLATYSWIGMDLLESNFENSTRLFAQLRKQPRATYRAFLEPAFLAQSPFFAAMPGKDQEEFWQSFVSWPKSPADWAHMMVNMMIGKDEKPVD